MDESLIYESKDVHSFVGVDEVQIVFRRRRGALEVTRTDPPGGVVLESGPRYLHLRFEGVDGQHPVRLFGKAPGSALIEARKQWLAPIEGPDLLPRRIAAPFYATASCINSWRELRAEQATDHRTEREFFNALDRETDSEFMLQWTAFSRRLGRRVNLWDTNPEAGLEAASERVRAMKTVQSYLSRGLDARATDAQPYPRPDVPEDLLPSLDLVADLFEELAADHFPGAGPSGVDTRAFVRAFDMFCRCNLILITSDDEPGGSSLVTCGHSDELEEFKLPACQPNGAAFLFFAELCEAICHHLGERRPMWLAVQQGMRVLAALTFPEVTEGRWTVDVDRDHWGLQLLYEPVERTREDEDRLDASFHGVGGLEEAWRSMATRAKGYA